MSQIYPAHQPQTIDHANNLIRNLEVDGETIVKINPENNLVYLTYMCQKGGKLSKDYLRLERTKSLIEALKSQVEIAPLAVKVVHGGTNPGTWVHPDIAIDAAMWISPKFGLAVSRLVRAFLTGQVTTEQSQAAAQQMQQVVQTVSPEDHEYRMLKMKTEHEENSKRFAERMLERSEEFEDVLVKQSLRDYATNYFSQNGQSSTSANYVDVPEILKKMGIPQKESGKHGRMIAKKFREEFGREPKKALKVVNGSQRECKVYSVQEVETIKTWF
jgi:hypothetical protein